MHLSQRSTCILSLIGNFLLPSRRETRASSGVTARQGSTQPETHFGLKILHFGLKRRDANINFQFFYIYIFRALVISLYHLS